MSGDAIASLRDSARRRAQRSTGCWCPRGSRRKARPSPGGAKIREEWEKAWAKWEDCVAESGDEHGRYLVREHHWEEPYLDGSSLAQDLEPIAAGMREILRSLHALGTLTLDLDVGASLRTTSPALHRLLSTRWQAEPAVSASRRRWVERLGVADLFPEVVEFWRRHAAGLVPDPANATGSNYDDCAEWLAVVFALDSAAYRRVVRGWAGPHARRKNLWLAITRRQLPL